MSSGSVRSSERPNELTWLQRAAIAMGPVLLLALYATWRIREINGSGWRRLRGERRAFIFALWHGHMLPLVVRHRSQGVRILISEHRDGEVIARIAGRLGLASIRGSSSRGAARALLAMCEALGDGSVVAVTPDGPRGPARSFASGTVVAAHRSGSPIVAIGVAASRAWHLRSWDAFMIPKPFASVVIAYSDPMFVDATNARAAAEQTGLYERALNDAVGVAERALGQDRGAGARAWSRTASR